MSKKDLNRYYLEVQNQYIEMLHDIVDLQKAVDSGLLPQERLDFANKEVQNLKENYKRISYVMYLLDSPQRKNKVDKYNKNNPMLLKYFDGHTETAVIEDNFNCLKQLKELLKGEKNE